MESLPAYDDKDRPPVYIEVVGPPPSFDDSNGGISEPIITQEPSGDSGPSTENSDGPPQDSNV